MAVFIVRLHSKTLNIMCIVKIDISEDTRQAFGNADEFIQEVETTEVATSTAAETKEAVIKEVSIDFGS